MSFALSKIQPPGPRRGTLLARPALEQRLLGALLDRRVVFVQAPAGYGKTALLVRALAQLPPGRGAAWVSLDPGDDLLRLLECLLAALEAFDPPWRVAPEAILSTATQGGTRGRQQAVDDLVNALEACELAHGAIVIDDVHHLDDDEADHFLLRFVERLGHRWTLVLASRHEPPFSLARIAAAGELAELRQADLQFTPDEVRAFFAQLAEPGAELDEAAVAALHARTGGWAAGLRLALNGARGYSGGGSAGGGSGAGAAGAEATTATAAAAAGGAIDRQAFDYLADEVLARIPAELRAFLVTTSVLPELDEARCRALTGEARAAAFLEEIERRGLFATFVDTEATPTLRLHDLFREALQHRLRVEQGGEAFAALLERAAASEPDATRRFALLLRAGRHDAAAVQLRALGWELLFQGGVATLLRLAEQFPPAVAEQSPEVQGVLGLARWHLWEARVAERHFARAEALYAQRGDAAGSATMRGYRAVTLLLLGRLQSAAPHVEAGLAMLQGGGPAAVEGGVVAADARVAALLAAWWAALEGGRFHAVAPRFAQLLPVLEAEQRLEYWWLVIPSPRMATCRGMAPLLGRWADGALAATGEHPLPLHTLALLARGWHALWQGRLPEAEAQLRRADAEASWTGQHVIARTHAMALRALVLALRGERASALALAGERVAGFPPGYGDWGVWQALHLAGRIAMLCGDAEKLRDWLHRLQALTPMLAEITPAQDRPTLGLRGSLAWLEGRHEEAEALWREALAEEELADLFGQASELRLRLAAAALGRGDAARAAAWLRPLLSAEGEVSWPLQVVAAPSPGGAVFAADVLRELAGHEALCRAGGLAPDEWAVLRRWADGLSPVAKTARAAVPGFATVAAAAGAPAGSAAQGAGAGAGAGGGGATSIAAGGLGGPGAGDTPSPSGPSGPFGPLTAREAEVLQLVARGQSNKLIARALDLSPHTVKRHVANLLDKLACNSRSEATAWFHAQRLRHPAG